MPRRFGRAPRGRPTPSASRAADRAPGDRRACGERNSEATDGPPSSAEPQPATKPAMASILHRFSRRRRDPKRPDGYETIAVLTTQEMLIAAVTNNSIPLIFAVALVVWYRFSEYVPSRAQDFMTETVEPRGVLAVVTALVVIAVVAGVVLVRVAAQQVHPHSRRRRAAQPPRPARQADRDHPRRPHPGGPGGRGVLAGHARVRQPAGGGGRHRPGEHQPAHALPARPHRSCRASGASRAARTALARAIRRTRSRSASIAGT